MVLVGGLTLFAATMVYLVVSSLSRRSAPEFDPTPPGRTRSVDRSRGVDTLTLDARDARTWHFVALDAAAVLTPPDTTGWDLAVRRHRIIAGEGGLIADLGAVAFDSVSEAPSTGYVANLTKRDTLNSAIERWYRYSMTSHLLEPNGHVFAVHTTDGRNFKVEVLSYYCRGLKAGCLTIRYTEIAAPRERQDR